MIRVVSAAKAMSNSREEIEDGNKEISDEDDRDRKRDMCPYYTITACTI